MIVRATKNATQLREAKVKSLEGMTKKKTSKPFIYLTQTEKFLPQNLNEIGVENRCNCYVIVLSYRTVCQEDNQAHLSYIQLLLGMRSSKALRGGGGVDLTTSLLLRKSQNLLFWLLKSSGHQS